MRRVSASAGVPTYAQNNPLIYTDPTELDCACLNNSGSSVEDFDQHSSSGECGKTGGYWVDGGLTNAKINANKGKVQLTGTNDDTDVTYASYKDTSVYVDSWLNTSLNQAGHITMALLDNNKWDRILEVTQTSYRTCWSGGLDITSFLERSSLKHRVNYEALR